MPSFRGHVRRDGREMFIGFTTTGYIVSSRRIPSKEIWLERRAQTVEMTGQVAALMSELQELAGLVMPEALGRSGVNVHSLHVLLYTVR